MYTHDGRSQCGETRPKYYDYQTAKKLSKKVVYDLLISFGQSLMLFRMSYLKSKNSHYSKIIKSSHRHYRRSIRKCAHYLIGNLLLKEFQLSKCSSSSPLSIDMDSVLFEHLWKKITQFKTWSNQNRPAEIDYCSLLYIQFHYNSTFMDEIFCGYSIDDACNFDASRASKANFIRQLYTKQNHLKNYVQYCIR